VKTHFAGGSRGEKKRWTPDRIEDARFSSYQGEEKGPKRCITAVGDRETGAILQTSREKTGSKNASRVGCGSSGRIVELSRKRKEDRKMKERGGCKENEKPGK